MSGHSKWSTIKRQKGVNDAKRGQVFTKLAREITIAARQSGGDVEFNSRLRLAVQRARENNMPLDNIERAIKRVTGGDGAAAGMEETVYEGYGPGGVAIYLEVVTENRNRTTADVRSTLSRGGGNLGEAGCVSWVFTSKGILTVEASGEEASGEEASGEEAEEMALKAIDAGAEDFSIEGEFLEVYCPPADLESLRQAMEAQGVPVKTADLSLVPNTTVPLDPRSAEQTLRLLDRLEELDDVQRVYTNADFPDEVLAQYRAET